MAKRSTTDAGTALNKLEKSAQKSEEQRAAIAATIPAPIYQDDIAWSRVFSDRGFNVRDQENYAYEQNKGLFQSLKEFGLLRHGDPMSFSLKPDGTLKVLVGNLRHAMMALVRKQEAEQREKSGIQTGPENPLPFERIFGLVYTGLTVAQETALMADHILRKQLNQFELAKEIGEFLEQHKLTDVQAGVYFGIDKSRVARLRMRYAMPTVFEEFRKEFDKAEGVPYYAVDNETLQTLYTNYLGDQEAGCGYREEGLNFKAAWRIFIAKPDAFKKTRKKGSGTPENASRPQDAIGNQANGLITLLPESGPELGFLCDALRWAGNITDVDGDGFNLNSIAESLTSYCHLLRNENDTLRAEIESLRTEVSEAKESSSVMEREYASLKAEFDNLNNANVNHEQTA